MKTEDALNRLGHYQDSILTTLDLAVGLVAGEPEQVREALATARWAMARQVREYQVFKHTEIFDPAMRFGTPQRAEQARRMAAQCIETGELLQQHLANWSRRDVVAEWSTYRSAMLSMVARVRSALASERAGVTALLAGVSRTRERRG